MGILPEQSSSSYLGDRPGGLKVNAEPVWWFILTIDLYPPDWTERHLEISTSHFCRCLWGVSRENSGWGPTLHVGGIIPEAGGQEGIKGEGRSPLWQGLTFSLSLFLSLFPHHHSLTLFLSFLAVMR
jgi:hypothetical protein